MNGACTPSDPQPFEVAGEDQGPRLSGFDHNFALHTLEIGSEEAGTAVVLNDSWDNITDYFPEALYVERLVIHDASTLKLNGRRIYYRLLTKGDNVTIDTSAGGALIPLAGTGSANFIRGEMNQDGSSNMADAIFMLMWLFAGGLRPPCPDAADANDDGSLDMADAITILQHLFAGGSPLPAPYPACGPDETEDALGCEVYPWCTQDPPAETPVVDFVDPLSGPRTGYTDVTIFGQNLNDPIAVYFGQREVEITAQSEDAISVIVPGADACGPVTILVIAAGGAAVLERGYWYVAEPNITSVSPSGGPAAGGTEVTITGSNFVQLDLFVTLCGVELEDVQLLDDSTIVGNTPPGIPGQWCELSVETPGGSALRQTAFRYWND
jgi:hypothetical protein